MNVVFTDGWLKYFKNKMKDKKNQSQKNVHGSFVCFVFSCFLYDSEMNFYYVFINVLFQ